MAKISPKLVDDWFGVGTYGDATYNGQRVKRAAAAYEQQIKKWYGPGDGSLAGKVDTIQYMDASITIALEKASEGRKVSNDQFWPIYDAWSHGIETVEEEIQILQAIFILGFLDSMGVLVKAFPVRELKANAQAGEQALIQLEKLLSDAKWDRVGAIVDKVGDVAMFLLPFKKSYAVLDGPIGGMLSLTMDQMLGPDGADGGKVARTGVTSFDENLHKLAGMTDAFKVVTKGASKLIGLYDVVDLDEIKKSFSRVDEIRDAIEAEKKARKYIVEVIWKQWEQRIVQFQIQMEQAAKRVKESIAELQRQRSDFRLRLAQSGYKPYMFWKFDS